MHFFFKRRWQANRRENSLATSETTTLTFIEGQKQRYGPYSSCREFTVLRCDRLQLKCWAQGVAEEKHGKQR